MKKWEYKIIDTKDVPGGGILKGKSRDAIEAYLNDLGGRGWEIVNLNAIELAAPLTFMGVAKREKS
ncbi:MAG: DUF4177 domain-containing protein [bacterium]